MKERPKLPAPLAFHRKGQQAMALAMIYPEPEKGGRGKTKERVEETSAVFSQKRLAQARLVLRHVHWIAGQLAG